MNGAWGKEKAILWLQIGAILLSLACLVIFIHFFLREQSSRYLEDFRRQNFQELLRGEVHVLGRKLAPVAKADFFSCVIAQKGGITFFEEARGACTPGIFQVASTLYEPNHEISILFVMRAPSVLITGFGIFLLLQLLLAGMVIFSQRAKVRIILAGDLALAAQARQFAHDIRSPLAALRTLARTTGSDQSTLKRAAQRLHDISRDLLPGQEGSSVAIDKVYQGTEILCAVREAIEEKRIEYAEKREVEIELHAKSAVWCPGEAFLWKRMISNLLNNAIEACRGYTPKINVRIVEETSFVSLAIEDNGKGLSDQMKARLGEASLVSEKSGGHGLGVSGAFRTMRLLGGRIHFADRSGGGTKVTLSVPKKAPPTIVLLDDDKDILSLWKKACVLGCMEFRGFSHSEEFLAVVAAGALPRDAILFIDVELGLSGHDHVSPAMEIGEKLASLNYENLFLCTGHRPDSLRDYPWAKGIIGKEPPWLDA